MPPPFKKEGKLRSHVVSVTLFEVTFEDDHGPEGAGGSFRIRQTLTWGGGGLALVGGVFWVVAALVSPGDGVWPVVAAALSVGTIVIAAGLGPRAGFWGWLAIRGFAVGVVALVAGQLFGGIFGPPLSGAGLGIVWVTGLFAAIGVRASGSAGRLGPSLAIVGWFLVYLTFILPIAPWLVAPYGAGWILTGVHLIRAARLASR